MDFTGTLSAVATELGTRIVRAVLEGLHQVDRTAANKVVLDHVAVIHLKGLLGPIHEPGIMYTLFFTHHVIIARDDVELNRLVEAWVLASAAYDLGLVRFRTQTQHHVRVHLAKPVLVLEITRLHN